MEVKEPAVDYFKRMTIEEYLAFENASDEKHEYYQGEVFTMSGAKIAHNRIATNTLVPLAKHLKAKPCEPLGSDLRIFVEQKELFAYPDISIFCEDIITRNNDQMNAVNPTALIEVLSPGTKAYDLGLKFALYKAINTLREYILIDSESVNVKVWFINQQGDWQLREYNSMEEKIWLHSISMEIPLQVIYRGTDLK